MRLNLVRSDISSKSEAQREHLFLTDVLAGLNKKQKSIPSKYLYDAAGSKLFEEICRVDDYYVTRIEREIIRSNASEIAAILQSFDRLIEYGPGSCEKTCLLLDKIQKEIKYIPIEISKDALLEACSVLRSRYPHLTITPICADYMRDFELVKLLHLDKKNRVSALFLGSTFGNLSAVEGAEFLNRVARQVGPHGSLLVGVDMIKNVKLLEQAYDDREGVTAKFNLNLLKRINHELNGTFDLAQFAHQAVFNEKESRVEMHLRSLMDQIVRVGGIAFHFSKNESMHTENSYKYSLPQFRSIAKQGGFAVRKVWQDPQFLFSVCFLERDNTNNP